MAQKFLLFLLLALASCSALTGRVRHAGAPVLIVEHDHRGGCWRGSRSACMRTLWVRNGSEQDALVDVECVGAGEWRGYRVPAGWDQGFAEWRGECRAYAHRP